MAANERLDRAEACLSEVLTFAERWQPIRDAGTAAAAEPGGPSAAERLAADPAMAGGPSHDEGLMADALAAGGLQRLQVELLFERALTCSRVGRASGEVAVAYSAFVAARQSLPLALLAARTRTDDPQQQLLVPVEATTAGAGSSAMVVSEEVEVEPSPRGTLALTLALARAALALTLALARAALAPPTRRRPPRAPQESHVSRRSAPTPRCRRRRAACPRRAI